MTLVTSIAIQKGGAAKTTTAVSLAAGIARKGHKTLLVDIDPQANASTVVLKNYESLRKENTIYATIMDRLALPVHQTTTPNLSVVPSHILLTDADIALTNALDNRVARLKAALDQIKDQYEYVFIDCPPHLGWLTLNALTASDQIICPINPGRFELESVGHFNQTVAKVRADSNSDLTIRGYLFTKADNTTSSKMSLKILRQTFPEYTFNNIIPSNVDLRNASTARMDIFSYNPRSLGAEAYQRLIEEVFNVK